MTVFDRIAETFDAYHYTPNRQGPTFEPAFLRKIEVPGGTVKIRFTNFDVSFSELPTAHVIQIPPSLTSRQLSHVNPDKSICYIDQETTKIFPLDPARVIATCIILVEKVVHNWSCDQNQNEIRAEFSSYWQPELAAIRLGAELDGDLMDMDRTALSGEVHKEYILVDNSDQVDSWQKVRKITNIKKIASAMVVEVKNPVYVPYGMDWPPSSMKATLQWLKLIDADALSVLVHKLKSNIQLNTKVIFIELRLDSESIAFQTILNEAVRASLKRKVKFKLNEIVNILSNQLMTSKFTRFMVEDSRESFIYTRNLNNLKTLAGEKIALIGCGTIGGYAAQALAHCGAGTENGLLHLFDNDILSAGNLGRHILGTNYLIENKSSALTHYLGSQLPFSNIQPHNKKFTNSDITEKLDIIIDATGDETFSIQLALWYRKYYQSNPKRPILIHGWIDAYGQCVRVLKDDGTGACYCCLCDFNGDEKIRLPLFLKPPEDPAPFRRKCGSTYMPFPSQVSMTAAGLIQGMALSEDGNKGSNFRQLALSTKIQTSKDRRLLSSPGCPVCNM